MTLLPISVKLFTGDSYVLENGQYVLKPENTQRTLIKTAQVAYGHWVKSGRYWLQYSTLFPKRLPVLFSTEEVEVPKENGADFTFESQVQD